MIFRRKHKVALALGGGGARGFANIGVLKVFERENIPVDILLGTSMGALAAVSFSLGTKAAELKEYALKFKPQDIADITFPKIALLKGEKLSVMVDELTGGKGFKDCKIPVGITATDINNGQELLYTSGNMQDIVKASCSWPGFFPPVMVDGRLLADGGLRNSIPVKWAKDMGATFVIAVKIGFAPQEIKADNILEVMLQSVQVLGEELDRCQSIQADIIIEPDMKRITQLDFDRSMDIIISGERAAINNVRKIKKALGL